MIVTKPPNLSTKYLTTAFEEVITSYKTLLKDLELNLYIVNRDHSVICYFNRSNMKILEQTNEPLPWLQHVRSDLDIAINGTAKGIKFSKDKGVIVCPIKIDHHVECYLCCPYERKPNPTLFFSIRLLSKHISFRITNQINMETIFLKNKYHEKICVASSEGSFTINKFGEITYMNQKGLEILEMESKDIFGKHVSDIFEHDKQLLEVLESSNGWVNRDFFIYKPNKRIHIVKSAIRLVDDRKQLVGGIFLFREIKTVRNFVANLVSTNTIYTFDDILFESNNMAEVIQLAKAAAKTDSSILIESESGTGKELIAQAIHNYSNRCNGPFITIDCSSIPHDLVESELFGYVQGAFTGAKKGGNIGKFELSHGGTIFLDEIGEMPLDMQSKLLRAIQSRTITRVGGNDPIPVDFRIIAATNRKLENEIRHRNFRLDLFYRLNVIHIALPPLRERVEDIPTLVNLFIEKTSKRDNRPSPAISNHCIQLLKSYRWPGNVRELENIIERVTILANEEIQLKHFPKYISELQPATLAVKENKPNPMYDTDTEMVRQSAERQLISNTLSELNGNKSLTAKKLGISRSSLYNKLKSYNITI
ncbi:sigma 54-interacting transcriptional regulator [Halalkalibacter alkaliphilus]|uniref:Sigma 54-interacting transcriptional regulator n=1 Tax=Halalkalibacter alkaliphilus TaxID=2917993 RepID=A0A9X2CUJ1_9BACI|nr:sigma 54-interacting transcriptional regulator [Halalkalibacter alkaliphilus]MCL7748488.1 sigma 54-interacting transcriptional regulator [Halalkalibacter alkaliphilus]